MQDKEITELVELRLKLAEESLKASKILLEAESCKSSANRSYYAVFHSMRALLATNKIDMKHHSGIISEFRRLYIKTGIFDTRLSEIVSEQYDLRTESDYDDFSVLTKEEATEQLENASYFFDIIKNYLDGRV